LEAKKKVRVQGLFQSEVPVLPSSIEGVRSRKFYSLSMSERVIGA
jgi:hypothetical protein